MIHLPNILLPVMLLLVGASVATAQPSSVDESLPLERYLEMGISSPDSSWSVGEYLEAVEALESISPKSLPRHGSAKSGALFARLVSTDPFLSDAGIGSVVDSGPQVAAMNVMRQVTHGRNLMRLLKLYFPKGKGMHPFSAEFIRLSLLTLQSLRSTLDLVHAIEIAGGEQPETPKTVEARKGMQDGMATVTISLVQGLDDVKHIRAADLEVLADGLRREIPLVYRSLSDEQQDLLRTGIRQVSTEHSNKHIRTAMTGLLADLRKQ
jgi:hypothetical protein